MQSEQAGLSSEQPSQTSLSYRQFKEVPLEELTPGTMIHGVRPARIFASQDWIDTNKTMRALNSPIDPERTLVVPAYVSFVPVKGDPSRMQRVLVLGDNHHHTLQQWGAERKVDVRIVGNLPPANHIGLSVLRQNAGSPFRD